MAGHPNYTDEQLQSIVEDVRESNGLSISKYTELLYFAAINEDTPQNRALFTRVINKYIYPSLDENGKITPPSNFSSRDLTREMNALARRPHNKYQMIFGIATIDGDKFLPKSITIDGYKYHQISWQTVRQNLKKHNKFPQFLNTFAKTVRPIEILPFPDSVIINFTGNDFYKHLERLLSKHIYYQVEIDALDAELATSIIDDTFGKVLWAATAAWATTAQGTTWTSSGLLVRRAPAMMNGVYQAFDVDKNNLALLQDTERKVKAEQKLLSSTEPKHDEDRLHLYRKILNMLLNPRDYCARTRLIKVTKVLHEALSSDNVNNRHLKLWQCVELGIGWRFRKEKDIIRTLKRYYDPSLATNGIWMVIGDYVHTKRCTHVHEGTELTWDVHGTYDPALNLYMDYVRVVIMMLTYFGDSRRPKFIRDEESFKKLMEYYAQDNKDLALAKWVKSHRYGN